MRSSSILFDALYKCDFETVVHNLTPSNVNSLDSDGNPWLAVFVANSFDREVKLLKLALSFGGDPRQKCATRTLEIRRTKGTLGCFGFTLLDIAVSMSCFKYVDVLYLYYDPPIWEHALMLARSSMTGLTLMIAIISRRGDNILTEKEKGKCSEWNINANTVLLLTQGEFKLPEESPPIECAYPIDATAPLFETIQLN